MLKRCFHLFPACKQPLHFLQLTILFYLLLNCIVYKLNSVRNKLINKSKIKATKRTLNSPTPNPNPNPSLNPNLTLTGAFLP